MLYKHEYFSKSIPYRLQLKELLEMLLLRKPLDFYTNIKGISFHNIQLTTCLSYLSCNFGYKRSSANRYLFPLSIFDGLLAFYIGVTWTSKLKK